MRYKTVRAALAVGFAISITVLGVATAGAADPTQAVDDAADTSAGRLAAISVLENDLGAGLVLKGIPIAPSHGAAEIGGRDWISYVPDNGYSGMDTFSYTIAGSDGLESTARVTVAVKPWVLNETFTWWIDTSVTVAVLENDIGTGLRLSAITSPLHGSAVIDVDSVVYTPAHGFTGEERIEYTVEDASGLTATGVVHVFVLPIPVVRDDHVKTAINTPVYYDVTANDETEQGIGMGAVTGVSKPSHGKSEVENTAMYGLVKYTPDHGFVGRDSFTYTYTSRTTPTITLVATVTVDVVNTPPPVTDKTVVVEGDVVPVIFYKNSAWGALAVSDAGFGENGTCDVLRGGVAFSPKSGATSGSCRVLVQDGFGARFMSFVTYEFRTDDTDGKPIVDAGGSVLTAPVGPLVGLLPVLAGLIVTGLMIRRRMA